MFTKKEREYYNIARDKACQRLGITKNQYNWLRRKGEELNKIYTANCNGDYDKIANNLNDGVSAETMYLMDCSRKEGFVTSKAKELKLFVYFQRVTILCGNITGGRKRAWLRTRGGAKDDKGARLHS